MGTIAFTAHVHGLNAAQFAKFEAELIPKFSPALDVLAGWLQGKSQYSFAYEHGGKTGETELSPQVIAAIPTPEFAQSKVRYGAHVGFVVDPIRSHIIASHLGNVLANPQVQLRPFNAFSPFGPVRGPVSWHQGGPESHSPDRTWYERWQPQLEVNAAIALHQFGAAMAATLSAQGFGMEHEIVGAGTPGILPSGGTAWPFTP